ncbi:MAG: hypothetical protein NZ742_04400, partial [Acidobacteria bacterium]|nr:hypothetical protein [Acidobacteriota bacterium]MDW7983823.1 hypothetical protein [Acidobacteriota bacterium]
AKGLRDFQSVSLRADAVVQRLSSDLFRGLDWTVVDFTQEPYYVLLALSPTLGGLAAEYFWRQNILGQPWANDPSKVSRAINRGSPDAQVRANAEDNRIALYNKALEVLRGGSP